MSGMLVGRFGRRRTAHKSHKKSLKSVPNLQKFPACGGRHLKAGGAKVEQNRPRTPARRGAVSRRRRPLATSPRRGGGLRRALRRARGSTSSAHIACIIYMAKNVVLHYVRFYVVYTE